MKRRRLKFILLFVACLWMSSNFREKFKLPALEFTELETDSNFIMPDFSTLFEIVIIIGILATEIWAKVINYF